MATELGRLERVELRSAWTNEAYDFTPWLALPYNLKLLGDAVGIELEVDAVEKSVGPFSADILCKNTATNGYVLIENQLEKTDHRHLGQLMTYAAGLKAETIVWIAQSFTEEHRAALDWINEIADNRFNCFGLEVELWRIGDSAMAPKFNIVAKPNDWSSDVHEGVIRVEGELTQTKQLQLEFWSGFREYADNSARLIKPTKACAQHWMNMSIGRSGFNLTAIASLRNAESAAYDSGEIRAQVEVFTKDAKSDYEILLAQKEDVEAELGYPLVWVNEPNKVSCKITIRKPVELNDRADWPNQFAWLVRHLDDLHRVFSVRVRQLYS